MEIRLAKSEQVRCIFVCFSHEVTSVTLKCDLELRLEKKNKINGSGTFDIWVNLYNANFILSGSIYLFKNTLKLTE